MVDPSVTTSPQRKRQRRRRRPLSRLLFHKRLPLFLLLTGPLLFSFFYARYCRPRLFNVALRDNQVLGGDLVAQAVSRNYGNALQQAEVTNCQLMRAGFNHNYVVTTSFKTSPFSSAINTLYVARVYLNHKYYIQSEDDFNFELDLIEHFRQQGLPVAPPIPANTGKNVIAKNWLAQIDFDETGNAWKERLLSPKQVKNEDQHHYIRKMALFEYARGQPMEEILLQHSPQSPQSAKTTFWFPDKCQALGALIAKFHQAADQFSNPGQFHRYHLNLETHLLDLPLQALQEHLAGSYYFNLGDVEFFQVTAQAIRNKFRALSQTSPTYGLIHADLHFGNLFYDATADAGQKQSPFTVIDWDHSAYGYRIYDLAPLQENLAPDQFASVMIGYESIRPFSEEEKELLPLVSVLREIWDVGDILRFSPTQGELPEKELLQEFVQQLKDLQQRIET